MYFLNLNPTEYERFKREAKATMKLKELSVADLSRITGYSERALYGFFCKTYSRFIAYAVADALEMKGWKVCGLE